jgi:chromosome segregation ATPase
VIDRNEFKKEYKNMRTHYGNLKKETENMKEDKEKKNEEKKNDKKKNEKKNEKRNATDDEEEDETITKKKKLNEEYLIAGILQTNGSANNSIVYRGPRNGLFYLNSKDNISYLSKFQRAWNFKLFD